MMSVATVTSGTRLRNVSTTWVNKHEQTRGGIDVMPCALICFCVRVCVYVCSCVLEASTGVCGISARFVCVRVRVLARLGRLGKPSPEEEPPKHENQHGQRIWATSPVWPALQSETEQAQTSFRVHAAGQLAEPVQSVWHAQLWLSAAAANDGSFSATSVFPCALASLIVFTCPSHMCHGACCSLMLDFLTASPAARSLPLTHKLTI